MRTSSTRSVASTAASTCGVDVIAVVDKFAFNVEICAEPFTLKRFKNGAACIKWLGKRMNPERAHDGEAIVLLVKCHELEVVSKFLDEYSGVSPLVPKVVGYGVESSECPAAHCTTTLDEAIDEAKSLMASRAPAAFVLETSASPKIIDDVEGLVWIAEEAGAWRGGTVGGRGFASSQKAIGWLERQMKLCHDSCAACSPKRRCPQCNKTYKHKSAQQLPWVGDKMRALVVAHHAPALEAYLSQFPENCGPMIDVVVYSGKAGDGFLSFEQAVQTLGDGVGGHNVVSPFAMLPDAVVPPEYGHGAVAYGSGDSRFSRVSRETPSTATGVSPAASEAAAGDGWERSERSGSDGDELSDGSSGSGSRRNSKDLSKEDLEDLRALTPVPEDSELPWLFMETIRAAQTDTLRLAGQLKLDVEDFQPGLRERLQVRTYDVPPTSGAGASVAQPTFQSSSSFTVSTTPGYNGMQTGSNFSTSKGFFAGGLQSAVPGPGASLSPTLAPSSSLPPNFNLDPSSSFGIQGMGFMPNAFMPEFQPGYIGNPLHPGHFGGPNSM